MELTHPINNEHMVNALNRVLRMTYQNLARCKHIQGKSDNMALKPLVNELMKAHTAHLEILRDSVRYLGGAPSTDPGHQSGALFPWSVVIPGYRLRRAEQRIIDYCNEKVRALAGADEVTETLNRVKDDIQACLMMTSGETD